MSEGDRDSDNSKKFVRFFIKACMICLVNWVPQSLVIVEGIPQVENMFLTVSLPL